MIMILAFTFMSSAHSINIFYYRSHSVDGVELNQIHGADTTENAEKEIGFFFPVQQTVAVIKPDAYENRDAIMDKIKEAGFHIAARRETELTKDTVAQLYKDQQDKEYFGDLAEHMTRYAWVEIGDYLCDFFFNTAY